MFQDFQKRENRIKKHQYHIGTLSKILKYLKTGKNFRLIF